MKRKFTYIILSAICGVIVLIFAIDHSTSLKRNYYILFHRSGIIEHQNSNGKLDGEVDFYINGKITRKVAFKNGLLDGWTINYYANGEIQKKSYYKDNKKDSIEFTYYSNGKIKSKESFKNGKYDGVRLKYYQNGRIENKSFRKDNNVTGVEYEYYEDGNLKYTRNWIDNHPYGDAYYYEDNVNKKVLFYHAYDILGIKFYLNRYDESRSDGYVFSSHIYSKDKDSVIVLKDNDGYISISDLYMTVANPESTSTQIQMFINNKLYKDLDFIDNNTIKATNVFLKKGIYDIVIKGRFVDKPDIVTTLKIKIIRE